MKLHTALLESLFGPIRLQILKQEGNLRMIHLFDQNGVSRTLGVVRFKNAANPMIEEAHKQILGGAMMGKTLVESKIPYQKTGLFQYRVSLPEWIRKDFKSDKETTVANYSHITIDDHTLGKSFLYAELFEIIPAEILHLVPRPSNGHSPDETQCASLLHYADIIIKPNDPRI